MDGYSTHNEALAYAFGMTAGPVVELGAGWYSTPLLHGMCEAAARDLYTVESDAEWLASFRPWMRTWHQLVLDPAMRIPVASPGVVFVDHDMYPGKPGHDGPSRGDSIRMARDAGATIVVVHDTEPKTGGWDISDNARGQGDALEGWAYRRDWRALEPWTAAVSDVHDMRDRP